VQAGFTTKEGKTDDDGELLLAGLTQDGNADITFLDHCKPAKPKLPNGLKRKSSRSRSLTKSESPFPVSGCISGTETPTTS
jgi:hypothetical protein